MSTAVSKNKFEAICPFCALLCDDITVRLDSADCSVEANDCHLAQSRYSTIGKPKHDRCYLHGTPIDHTKAIQTAAEMISKSKALVIAGMLTDVAGARAALKLAERKCAVIMQSDGKRNSLQTSRVQRSGGYFTTLAEIRNRADLIIMFGREPVSACPRILDTLCPQRSKPDSSDGRVSFVAIGTPEENDSVFEGLKSFECSPEQYGMLTDAIRLRVENKRHNSNLGFISDEQIDRLTAMITKANYPVLVWSESDFQFSLGDLAIDSINQLIETLNIKKRSAGLVVSGSASSSTVNQVATWQFGKPTPLSFRSGKPNYFPEIHSIDSIVKRNDVDIVLWVGGLDENPQIPESTADIIAISHSMPTNSQLFIPIGIPGIHHDAHLFRTDQVVAMHARHITPSLQPSGAEVLTSILNQLEPDQC